MESFSEWFETAVTEPGQPVVRPHPWQEQLADDDSCCDRLIRIPTGLGKTLGVLLAWAYHRLHRQDQRWPRRLVWCLPMRTLVDQTANEARKVISKIGLGNEVDVHRLMGGIDETQWYGDPERPAVLIGTQDMLLSRALNRGYAMGRAAWPRAFGMLHCDALWVMDEIQLMGVGLTTSAQIQALWHEEREKWRDYAALPRATWWMSATLQPEWLRTPETDTLMDDWTSRLLTVASHDRIGPLWEARKKLTVVSNTESEWAATVIDAHRRHTADPQYGRQTLVVVNRVNRAKELFAAIDKQLKSDDSKPELRLVHSRFRPHDRAGWSSQFLSKQTLGPNVDRIIIATQVVEAGVDISASCLITELAPWPSLVQRFGRAARYGGEADVIVLDPSPGDEKQAAPYALAELNSAREALSLLSGSAIGDLDNLEASMGSSDPEMLARLYPFQPLHVLMRHEFNELFDTSPDLSGADLDVSRFIREGEEQRDVQVFWRRWDSNRPSPTLQPSREELCSVGIGEARTWVSKITKDSRGRVWAWDYVDGVWQDCRADSLRPGIVILVAEEVGGYDPQLGFTGERPKKGAISLDLSGELQTPPDEAADLKDGSDETSASDSLFKTIATHAYESSQIGTELAKLVALNASLCDVVGLALRLHDWGKAHPAFAKGTYRVAPPRADLAKAPRDAWPSPKAMYDPDRHSAEGEHRFGKRPGFRHELVSALATMELLHLAMPDHPAFLSEGDPDAHGRAHDISPDTMPGDPATSGDQVENTAVLHHHPIAKELAALGPVDFNLLLFLIASHHGKVRMSLQAAPVDQQFPIEDARWVGSGMPIRGIREGDPLPAITLADRTGADVSMPDVTLSLAPAAIGLSERYGPSWSERMLDLVLGLGPFFLGYLEAIVRASDARASALTSLDHRLLSLPIEVAQRNGSDASATELGDDPGTNDQTDDDDVSDLETTDA
jgi:CRISPR-associated endonuclease/helicase Cas3